MWQQLKKAWAAWKRIAHVIGDFQARVLLTADLRGSDLAVWFSDTFVFRSTEYQEAARTLV